MPNKPSKNLKEHETVVYNPSTIDMSTPKEFDHEMETLRILKERENQMKQEKLI